MKCFSGVDEESEHSKEIDKLCREDAKQRNHITQLLLLGTGESGKLLL